MAIAMSVLLDDLRAETDVLDALLAPLPPAAWDTPTPAAGWSIRDQVSHLAYFDEVTTRQTGDPDVFRAEVDALVALGDYTEHVARRFRTVPAGEMLAWFRGARVDLIAAFAVAEPTASLPWFGPPMSAVSSMTARLMETWAHGQDVADALGVRREPTARLRHVAHLGVATRGFALAQRGLPAPTAPVHVALAAPDGGTWTWGPPDAADRVTGPAEDFCLLVTRRRHRDDLALEVHGDAADTWVAVAQAFAGPPGEDPRPGGPR